MLLITKLSSYYAISNNNKIIINKKWREIFEREHDELLNGGDVDEWW